jgi:hypothetical protein
MLDVSLLSKRKMRRIASIMMRKKRNEFTIEKAKFTITESRIPRLNRFIAMIVFSICVSMYSSPKEMMGEKSSWFILKKVSLRKR